jgi:hypothetical protein
MTSDDDDRIQAGKILLLMNEPPRFGTLGLGQGLEPRLCPRQGSDSAAGSHEGTQ